VMYEINPRMPARFFLQEPEVVRQLHPNREAYRIFHEADWYGREPVASPYFGTGDAVYWIVRNGMLPMLPAGYDFNMVVDRDYDKTALLPTLDFIDSVWDIKRYGRKDWWRPVVAMSNAWYRAEYRPFEQEKKRTHGNLKQSHPIDYREIREHYPRYYFAEDVVTIRDRRDFVDKLLKPGAYPLSAAFISGRGFKPARGTVRGVAETSNTARIDVDVEDRRSRLSGQAGLPVPHQAFLVMSVTPHKYWRVTIDGKPADSVITNIGYQGVVVPAGRHRVFMRYRNTLAANAAIVSIVATILLLGAAVFDRRRRIEWS